mmetsp:Transcript_17031/g.14930  ORF Transcript_17031/g.14930 Transcript_17031/m.14930 type:complete len:131 (-) Transcript_17031:390-782(-)
MKFKKITPHHQISLLSDSTSQVTSSIEKKGMLDEIYDSQNQSLNTSNGTNNSRQHERSDSQNRFVIKTNKAIPKRNKIKVLNPIPNLDITHKFDTKSLRDISPFPSTDRAYQKPTTTSHKSRQDKASFEF